MEKNPFHYQPTCSVASCGQPAVYKVAAPWTSGTSRELKNYGLACTAHGQAQLELAKKNREGLKVAVGETVGPVGLYQLVPGKRDAELVRLPEQ
jgi:hypothetical protein